MKNKRRHSAGQAVVLLSGGLDSATALYIAKKHGFKCRCLIFDYGQRHRREIESAKRLAHNTKCTAQIVKIKLPWKGSALLDRGIKLHSTLQSSNFGSSIPSTYVPARNIIFLSFALSYAEAIGASAIFIGAHIQDYPGYPDCRREFFKAFARVVSAGTKAGVENKRISIQAPLINYNKAKIIRLGRSLGVPFELTWSCYRGGVSPCGKCDSCYFRAKGFKEVKLKDPLIK